MATPLADTLARRLDLSPEVVRRTLPAFLQGLRNEVEEKGRAEVPGLGTFARGEDGTLTFEPDQTLARAVNRHYAGLEPLSLPETPQTAASEEPESAGEDWQRAEADDDHPLGPLPMPDYEEADYSLIDREGAAEKVPPPEAGAPRTPPRREVLLPPSLTLAALSSRWAQNRHLAPENLTGAQLLSPEAPGTAPAAEAEPAAEKELASEQEPAPGTEPEPAPIQAEEKEPGPPSGDGRERRPAALPWVLGLLALLVAGFGAWYVLAETGLVAGPFAATSSSAPTGEEAPEEPASDLTADTAEATAGAAPDTSPAASGEEPPGGDPADEAPEEEPEVELAPAGIDRSAGGWTLVVASRPDRSEAEEIMRDFRERFSGSGFAVDIFTSPVEGAPHHRIAVGHFESTSEALQAKEEFSDRYPENAWLLPIEPNT